MNNDFIAFWVKKLTKFNYTHSRYLVYDPKHPLARSVIGALAPTEPTTEDLMKLFPLTSLEIRVDSSFYFTLELFSLEPYSVNGLMFNRDYPVDEFFKYFNLNIGQIAFVLTHAQSMGNLTGTTVMIDTYFEYFIKRQEKLDKLSAQITGETTKKGSI
jgi:hypothetical protein